MMRKFIGKILKYLVFGFIIINAVGVLFDFIYVNSVIFKPMIIRRNSANSVVLGSSRSLTGLNTQIIQNTSSVESRWFNFSIDDTPLETHLIELKLLLKSSVKLKSVLLQYDRTGVPNEESKLQDRDYQFLPLCYRDYGVLWNYFIKKEQGFGAALYLLPGLKYIYFNTELTFPLIKRILLGDYRYRSNDWGDYTYPSLMVSSKNCKELNEQFLNLKDNTLNEFINLCNQNNIRLYLYVAPFQCESMISDTLYRNVKIINYSRMFNGNQKYFADDIHINNSAVDSLTNRLVGELN